MALLVQAPEQLSLKLGPGTTSYDCEHEYLTLRSVLFAFSPQIVMEACHKCGRSKGEIELAKRMPKLLDYVD